MEVEEIRKTAFMAQKAFFDSVPESFLEHFDDLCLGEDKIEEDEECDVINTIQPLASTSSDDINEESQTPQVPDFEVSFPLIMPESPNSEIELTVEQLDEADRSNTQATSAPTQDIILIKEESIIQLQHDVQVSYVAEELISTELDYLRSLHFLRTKFLKPLNSKLRTNEDQRLAYKVNNYLKMIKNFGAMFVSDLTSEESIEGFGEVFIRHQTYFLMYSKLSRVWNAYLKLTRQEFLKENIKNLEEKLNKPMGFGRYVAKPMQRITKYELLLNQLQKKMTTANMNTTGISKACDFMKDVLNRCNTIVALYNIALHSFTEDHSGHYISKYNLKWKASKKKKRVTVPVEMFLFEKLIIVAVNNEERLEYRDSIFTSKLTLNRKDNERLKFSLEDIKRPSIINLVALSPKDKQIFLDSIEVLLWKEVERVKEKQTKRMLSIYGENTNS